MKKEKGSSGITERDDGYERELRLNVSPDGWVNPDPAPIYDLVVVGAGTAGLVAAAGAAGLGARVALVEKHRMGGDCLNTGCVPSKCLVRSSRAVVDVRNAVLHGIQAGSTPEADFRVVMDRMKRLRARISRHDSVSRFSALGVDVFLGEASFSGKAAVEVAGKTLRFKKAVIAAGARAAHPPIQGLARVGYVTSETVFSLKECPPELAVIGAGHLGCELAQAFQRLGSRVTILEKAPRLLEREDRDAAAILYKTFVFEGIGVVLGCDIREVEPAGGRKRILYRADGIDQSVEVDEILVGAGRVPNVDGLNLESAGVDYDRTNGVIVNDFLQTANSRIYAAGDVCLSRKFTHTADATARIVIRNALFLGRRRLSTMLVPWCTYTDPEIAHVGMYEGEALARGIRVDTFTKYLSEVDRAIVDGEEEGFVKVHVRHGTDKILGATIVARHAGEMLNEITLAMEAGVGLRKIADVIHPYPTQAEAIRQAADLYNRSRLTATVRKILSRWLAWRK